MKRPNYDIYVHYKVMEDSRLSAMEKILFSELLMLSLVEGYTSIGNKDLADWYKVSERTIKGYISHLIECDYVKRAFVYENNKIVERVLFVRGDILDELRKFRAGE